jgi:hypothetical protein
MTCLYMRMHSWQDQCSAGTAYAGLEVVLWPASGTFGHNRQLRCVLVSATVAADNCMQTSLSNP